MATARELVSLLLSQDGDRYIFGHEVKASDTNPTAFDCSELVQWGCDRLKVVPVMPDGTWNQVTHCRDAGSLLTIDEAIRTAGALLFSFSSSPFTGKRPKAAHVAVSQGNGSTIEARSTKFGVGQFSAKGRGWTHAGLIPGLTYSTQSQPIPPQGADMAWAPGKPETDVQTIEDIDRVFAEQGTYFAGQKVGTYLMGQPESAARFGILLGVARMTVKDMEFHARIGREEAEVIGGAVGVSADQVLEIIRSVLGEARIVTS